MVLQIVVPITRPDRVIELAQMIARLDTGEYRKKVLVVLDNNIICKRSVELVFTEAGLVATVYDTGHQPPYSHNVNDRRRRITDVWNNFIKPHVDNEASLVLGIEDDGNFGCDAFVRLEKIFREKEKKSPIGFVSGIEAGRWGIKMLGAWRTNRPKNYDVIKTVPYRKEGVYQVEAAGLYFFIVRPYILQCTNFVYNYFGPDINFGLSLREKGYLNFIDYSVIVKHIDSLNVYLPDADCKIMKFKKDSESEQWAMQTIQ